MTSIIKVQNIQYTDGDAALTIANGGGVTAASTLTSTGAFTSPGIDDNADAVSLTIDSSENITLNAGNLIVGTAGKGIDFSAASNVGGMTSELLDDYEEGTWTPTLYGSSGSAGSQQINGREAKYVKVGRLVYVTLYFYLQNGGAGSWTGTNRFGGFPFTSGTSNWQALAIGADGINYAEISFTLVGNSTYGHIVDRFTGTPPNYSAITTGYNIQMSGCYYTT